MNIVPIFTSCVSYLTLFVWVERLRRSLHTHTLHVSSSASSDQMDNMNVSTTTLEHLLMDSNVCPRSFALAASTGSHLARIKEAEVHCDGGN